MGSEMCIRDRTLLECGYQAEVNGDYNPARVMPSVSFHVFRVAIKTILPILLRTASLLRFPVLRLLNWSFPSEWREVKIDRPTE